ncbi:uncharacterized protein C8Q71DRAFT_432297 [Rhodofomes roseus]|uniref:Uncharacterized protein n=1 Tax=Rhodofomes roseus TaxID=34475 RepID=A0ABQ8KRA4_9APHY|nr:uncharacterized protein C8Q71DRAFT_432297 [Rhodofomes roseus]KAH9840958.1 hypothetical protein C8Q71DRAFT_432297 [Rhodofomes roseus]
MQRKWHPAGRLEVLPATPQERCRVLSDGWGKRGEDARGRACAHKASEDAEQTSGQAIELLHRRHARRPRAGGANAPHATTADEQMPRAQGRAQANGGRYGWGRGRERAAGGEQMPQVSNTSCDYTVLILRVRVYPRPPPCVPAARPACSRQRTYPSTHHHDRSLHDHSPALPHDHDCSPHMITPCPHDRPLRAW